VKDLGGGEFELAPGGALLCTDAPNSVPAIAPTIDTIARMGMALCTAIARLVANLFVCQREQPLLLSPRSGHETDELSQLNIPSG
jgi:hypothetical protein